VITNAAETVDTFYRLIGFRSLGHGQGWGMKGEQLSREPQPQQVALAEAIGWDDVETISELRTTLGPDALDAPLANGMTPLQFAARTGARDSADRLLHHGAAADVLSLWDLGRVADLHDFLDKHPDRLNERRAGSGRTLLHVAVQRDDAALVDVLLAHGADLAIRDSRFDATAEQWAVELRHHRIRRLLEAARDSAAGAS
jgi:ankyrin repeat protein